MSNPNSYIEQSRIGWHTADGSKPDREALKLGCLQRIASATELMAQKYQSLIDERDRYIRWYESECDTVRYLRKQNAGLRGQITKMKRKEGNR